MTDKEKIIKLKEIISNQNAWTRSELLTALYESTLKEIEDSFLEWNKTLNELKGVIYHDD